ncbi:histidine kinase [Pseudoalteromonas sp. JBTF-M23]|uniref:Histidine kinase n=1 Tax=Pseudoalteromonas caenipelagi TaxID=2726988 RepID=A0A849VB67_9GAMM|nr:histidine kinase [Pseudoalteromonas caenipelagi]NOU50020.1 histidine kinase [Pseudoalteromonas caenipelagi]
MEQTIRHTTDWTYSTIASWLGVTIACFYYTNVQLNIWMQIPIHLALLGLLWFIIKRPNDYVDQAACAYFVLLVLLMQLTTTSLVFIHLVMFTAIFSAHFPAGKMLLCVITILTAYSMTHWQRWEGDIPWVTLLVWFFFSVMNWFVSRRIVESLNIHYQSKQNYKELKATQSLVTAMGAEQERLSLSRELHDTLGHKLTALSINLDFAKRQASSESIEAISLCHSLSQEILEEVREIVSKQRQKNTLLNDSLHQVFAATPQLICTLSISDELGTLTQQQSICVVRFCQEMISNTLKHTKATEIQFNVQVKQSSDNTPWLIASALHNQKELKRPKPGNGLKGLDERLQLLSGSFKQYICEDRLFSEISFPLIPTGDCDESRNH